MCSRTSQPRPEAEDLVGDAQSGQEEPPTRDRDPEPKDRDGDGRGDGGGDGGADGGGWKGIIPAGVPAM